MKRRNVVITIWDTAVGRLFTLVADGLLFHRPSLKDDVVGLQTFAGKFFLGVVVGLYALQIQTHLQTQSQ